MLRRILAIILIVVLCALLQALARAIGVSAAIQPDQTEIQDLHLVSTDDGWLLLNQHLYWTENRGQTWIEITPADIGTSVIRAVAFLDAQHGWLILQNSTTYAISQTTDRGRTWQTRSLTALTPDDLSVPAAAFYFHWLDVQNGWLVMRRATGSNFSVGALFQTTDGGKTWTRNAIPIGEPVYFATDKIGWTAGGAAGHQLYRTRDGGATWQPQQLTPTRGRRLYQLPKFDNAAEGVLPVIVEDGDASQIQFYRTYDGGQSWGLESNLRLGDGVARLPFDMLNVQQSIVIVPRSNQLARITNRRMTTITTPDAITSGITKLDMATLDIGWAKHNAASCTPKPNQTCTSTTQLLETNDGGQTWTSLPLPNSTLNVPSQESPRSRLSETVSSSSVYTLTFSGQGFDKCEIARLGDLEKWWTNSPYAVVNLYIGGSARGCPNTALTAKYVSQISQQGWKFIPTWVGPQAACTGFSSRMSSDPTVAYNQGISEANAAIAAMVNLGLAEASGSGAVIYYDLEAYDVADTACRNAANSFISGWSGQLQGGGNVAGAYGAAYGSAVSDWLNIANVPDALWLAHWFLPAQYRSDATVWDPGYVPDTAWANHQRIRQYAGGHDETWGSVTLNIDSNVIDGIVANVATPVSVKVTSVWTADANGNAQSTFNPGDTLRYSAAISNTSSVTQTVALNLTANGECGPLTSWTGNWPAGPSTTTWVSTQRIPDSVCGGAYTYRLNVTFDEVTTAKSTPFTVMGTTYRLFLPLSIRAK